MFANELTRAYVESANDLYDSVFHYYKRHYNVTEKEASDLAANAVLKFVARDFSVNYSYALMQSEFKSDLYSLYYSKTDIDSLEQPFSRINANNEKNNGFNFLESLVLHPKLLSKKLSTSPGSLLIKNSYEKNLLMVSAHSNKLESSKIIIETNPSLLNEVTNKPKPAWMGRYGSSWQLNRDNRTALMYASENSDKTLIDLLIKSGADITILDSSKNSFLAYIFSNSNLTYKEKSSYYKSFFNKVMNGNQPKDIKFDCQKANNMVDMFICSLGYFSTDSYVNGTYSELKEKLNKEDGEKLKQQQIAWIKSKGKVCSDKYSFQSLSNCIQGFYSERWSELRVLIGIQI